MIDLDTFTSEATKKLDAKRPELEDAIEQTRSDAEKTALMKPKIEVIEVLAEEYHWHMMSSAKVPEVATRYAEKYVEKHSIAYKELELLHAAAECDRAMADLVNDAISNYKKAEASARKMMGRELPLGGLLTASPSIVDLPEAWELNALANMVVVRYDSGTEFRTAIRQGVASAMDAVLSYPDLVFNTGAGSDSQRATAAANVRAGVQFIAAVAATYAGDATMSFTLAELVPPPF